MKIACATMFLTFVCALTCANCQYWHHTEFDKKDCAGSPTEDIAFSFDIAMKVAGLDKCSLLDGKYAKVDSATCTMTMHTDSACSEKAVYTHGMSYSNAECDNKNENSEKKGCVSTIPASAKDFTCMTEEDIAVMTSKPTCTKKCTKAPTTEAEFDEMATGCGKDCTATVKSILRKYYVGCPSVIGTASSAHSQYARLFMVLAILLGLFSL